MDSGTTSWNSIRSWHNMRAGRQLGEIIALQVMHGTTHTGRHTQAYALHLNWMSKLVSNSDLLTSTFVPITCAHTGEYKDTASLHHCLILHLPIYCLLIVYQQKQEINVTHFPSVTWTRLIHLSRLHLLCLSTLVMWHTSLRKYTEECLTNSRLNERQSAEATLPQQKNVAIVCMKARHDGELCLNPSFHIYTSRGLKDRWSPYRFPHSIFRQTLSASNLLAQLFLFPLHSAPSNFLCLSLCLYLSDVACTNTLRHTPYIRIGEKKGTFRSPASISPDSWGGLIQSLPAGEVDSRI